MKRLISPAILFLLSVSVLLNCTKTENTLSNPVVTVSYKGRVTDLNNRPVEGATVTAGTASTTTDINGEFIISNVQTNQNNGFVKVTKTGYFNGSRTIKVNESSSNYILIKLIPMELTGNFDASSGGTVNAVNGGTITFPANAIVYDATGASYSGLVSVYAFYLDPTVNGSDQYMPGALRGIRSNNSEVMLASFGMMVVELRSASGNKLQIASGKKADVSMPIPSSLQANAPSSIPLWHFDETKGLWTESGTATKNGTNYIGSVSHFSWVNCDLDLSDPCLLNIKVLDQNNVPLPGVWLSVVTIVPGYSGYAIGKTDSIGNVGGMVPANTQLKIEISDGCGNVIYYQNVGPYTSNSINNLTINLNYASPVLLVVSGSATDCNNTPLTSGYAELRYNYNHYERKAIVNGAYSFNIHRCSADPISINVTVVKSAILVQPYTDTNFIATAGNVVLGPLRICDSTTDQYIISQIDGVNYRWGIPNDFVDGKYFTVPNNTQISSSVQSNGNYFRATFSGGPGLGYRSVIPSSFAVDSVMHTSLPTNQSFNLLSYDTVGGYIEGSWNDSIKRALPYNDIVPIHTIFRVKRTQ